MPLSPEVRRARRAYNNPPGTPEKGKCENCGVEFTKAPHRSDQRFCSDKCRKEWHRHGTAFPQVLAKVRTAVADELDRRTAVVAAVAQQAESLRERIMRLEAEFNGLKMQYDRLLKRVENAKRSPEAGQMRKLKNDTPVKRAIIRTPARRSL